MVFNAIYNTFSYIVGSVWLMEVNGVPRGNDQIMQWAIEKGQNDVQYTTQIIKDETTRTPLNTGGNAAAPERLNISY